jgi:phenylalanyl-tRNA synthetase alpha chain
MNAVLEPLRDQALADIAAAANPRDLDALRVRYLGRAGSISQVSERMKELPKEERPSLGRLLNEVRTAVSTAIDDRAAALRSEADRSVLAGIDVTLPGTPLAAGSLHPITILMDRAVALLRRMGFAMADGPDIETEWHCFDALNTPADHPARNEQDTFYLPDGRLLRTQTSTVQIRVMESVVPPVRIIAPGACYRRDEIDATHLAQFNQVEGLYIDEGVSLADLRDTVYFFVRELFGPRTEVRMRPHFFPFTEPSYEIDIRSAALGDRWLELAGCGMVDPAVFDQVNVRRGDRAYDPERWTGFAFGFGIDRLAMILAGLPDIRLLVENDLRFLSQYRG